MKILSLNCRAFYRDLNKKKPTYWKTRAGLIKKLIIRENPDIILFQELTFPMTCFVLPKGYKRANLWFRPSISHHVYCRREYTVCGSEWHLHWCRSLIADLDDNLINVFSIHSHWDRDVYKKFAGDITKKVKGYPEPIINIIGGDWNVSPEAMRRLMRPLSLKTSDECTFQNWGKPEQFGELDYFAYSHCKPTGVVRLDDFVSDHYAVAMQL